MSRISSASGSDQIVVKPTNNVYTALAVVGFVTVVVGLVLLWIISVKLQGTGPFQG